MYLKLEKLTSSHYGPCMVTDSLPRQTLRARFTGDEQGDERAREGGSADSEQDSVLQWNVYYEMMT